MSEGGLLRSNVVVAYPNPAENAADDGDKGVGVYAGRDGNVYRKEGDSWQKYGDGGWNKLSDGI